MKQENIIFEYEGEEQKGVLIQEDKEETVIKLRSGYNIIVPTKELTIKKREAIKKTGYEKKVVPTKKGLKKITILHTGGTIASKVDYSTGAVTAQFSEEEILALFPELKEVADITSVLVSNVQSEMMRPQHWNILAQEVKKAQEEGAQGIIVTHGTDTMHYTSAALSFMLEGISLPVILVGSQRSSDRPSSDAATNLLSAATFIAQTSFCGVAVCMHENNTNDNCAILEGTKVRKMHTSRRDAFKPINSTAYARITNPGLRVEQLRKYPVVTNKESSLKLFGPEKKVGLYYAHPLTSAQELLSFGDYDGLVLGLYGIGHMPTQTTDEYNQENDKVLQVLEALAKKIVVVGAPQTMYGRVDMNIYSPGKTLIATGVLGQGLDMTPETAYVKLLWLLSNYETKDVRRLYVQDLCGEISSQTRQDGYE